MKWRREEVAEVFKIAVRVSYSMPRVGPYQPLCIWPELFRTIRELLQMERLPRRWQPSKFEIACWDASLEWVALIDKDDDRTLIWARAARLPWKLICGRLFKRMSRQYLFPRWMAALDIIVSALNQHKTSLSLRYAPLLEGLKQEKEDGAL